MARQIDMRTRREAVQRIQVGMVGLGIVLLVVASTNVVVRTLRPEAETSAGVASPQLAAGASNGIASAQGESEPLADLGVTPRAEQSVPDAADVGPSVPDLEPDPRLTKPMDRDPKRPPAPAAGRN